MNKQEAIDLAKSLGATLSDFISSSATNMGGGDNKVKIGLISGETWTKTITNGDLNGKVKKQNVDTWHGFDYPYEEISNYYKYNFTDVSNTFVARIEAIQDNDNQNFKTRYRMNSKIAKYSSEKYGIQETSYTSYHAYVPEGRAGNFGAMYGLSGDVENHAQIAVDHSYTSWLQYGTDIPITFLKNDESISPHIWNVHFQTGSNNEYIKIHYDLRDYPYGHPTGGNHFQGYMPRINHACSFRPQFTFKESS